MRAQQQSVITLDTARLALKRQFGYEGFLSHQGEIIEHILAGEDVFAILPTGGGKSLLYQLPGFLLRGTAVIVCPLVALMENQCEGLRARGIDAHRLHSGLSQETLNETLEALKHGSPKPKFIYVSPERLRMMGFIQILQSIPISLLAVDEVHCVSEWGHDFRPSYLSIAEVRDAIGKPPLVAVTATAHVEVRDDVTRLLGLQEAFTYFADPDRPEIDFQVEYLVGYEAKLSWLITTLKSLRGKTIVYCSRTQAVDELATAARTAGLKVANYHGKMDAETRRREAAAFARGAVSIMIATEAFGLGMDFPDIRYVIHYQLPASLQQMMQEAGRAGRDHQSATHMLAYEPHDVNMRHRLITGNQSNASYIWTIYQGLCRFFTKGPRVAGAQTYFDKDRYLNEGGGRAAGTKTAALAALEDWGLVKTGPFWITLLDDEITDRSHFPINQEVLDAQVQQRLLQLGVIVHYVNAEPQERRDILLTHLRYNGIAGLLNTNELESTITLPRIMVEGLLRVCAEADYTQRQLELKLSPPADETPKPIKPGAKTVKKPVTPKVRLKKSANPPPDPSGQLSPPGTQTNSLLHASTRALEKLKRNELQFLIERLAALGLVSYHPVRTQTYVVITVNGLAWLEKEAGYKPELGSDWAQLQKALYHPTVRLLVGAALESVLDTSLKTDEITSAQIEQLLIAHLRLGESRVLLSELVEGYLHAKLPKPPKPLTPRAAGAKESSSAQTPARARVVNTLHHREVVSVLNYFLNNRLSLV